VAAVAAVAAVAVVPLGGASALADSGWLWPLSPRPAVVRGFEPPPGPYAPGHRGVDLGGTAGQRVLAVADGVVSFTGRVAGVGVVSVDTAAGRVTYQPVMATVRRGEPVVAGEVLGALSTVGGHCLPRACLHLGLVVGDTYHDPLALLGGGAVRLLPISGPLAPTGPPVGAVASTSTGPGPRPVEVGLGAALGLSF